MNEKGVIEDLEHEKRRNNQKGTHTFSMCECGKRSCRRYKCNECIDKEIGKLKIKYKGCL